MDGLYALNVFTQRLRGFMDRAAGSRNFPGRVDRPRHVGTHGGNNRRRRGLVDRFGAVARGAAFAMVSMAAEQLSYLPALSSRILHRTKPA